MRATELDYDLPAELVAQRPVEPRDAARMLVYDRATQAVRHRTVRELPDELDGHLVVVNDTRVVPARLPLRRATGGEVELLLLERRADGVWEAVEPARLEGKFYGYRVAGPTGPADMYDPSVVVADPYSRAVVTKNE